VLNYTLNRFSIKAERIQQSWELITVSMFTVKFSTIGRCTTRL